MLHDILGDFKSIPKETDITELTFYKKETRKQSRKENNRSK